MPHWDSHDGQAKTPQSGSATANLLSMAIYVPVVRKYRVGDHVGLEEILAVGIVIARRGVVTGLGSDDGSGRYYVEFDGVPENVHVEMLRLFCQCNAHVKFLRRVGRRMKKGNGPDVVSLVAEAERDCESEYLPVVDEIGKSRIWYRSSSLLNCSGKERLPLNANVRYGTPPPFFEVASMGRWDPSRAPRYQHGTKNA